MKAMAERLKDAHDGACTCKARLSVTMVDLELARAICDEFHNKA